MKKRGVIIIKNFISLIVIFICLCLIFFVLTKICEYSDRPKNQKSDDEISQAVYEAIGGREICYQGSEFFQKKNNTVYTYIINTSDKTILPKLVETVNEVMTKNERNDRICIRICTGILSGATISLMAFTNYSEKDGSFEDYDKIQVLELWGADFVPTVYNEPAIYEGFQDITYLKISHDMTKITEKENIDWYEYFPDLETLEVVPIKN